MQIAYYKKNNAILNAKDAIDEVETYNTPTPKKIARKKIIVEFSNRLIHFLIQINY